MSEDLNLKCKEIRNLWSDPALQNEREREREERIEPAKLTVTCRESGTAWKKWKREVRNWRVNNGMKDLDRENLQ